MTTATAEMETETGTDPMQTEDRPSAPSYDDINTPVILMVGVISAIVTVCTIFFVQGLCYQWQNSYVRERSFDYVNEPVRSIVEEQKNMLTGQQEGIKSIDDTMAEVIQEYGKK